MNIVILAAGRGVRLGFENQNFPKSLVTIGSTPYLKLQLDSMSLFSAARMILVGGFGIEHLESFLSKNSFHHIQLLNNTEFLKGNLYSITTARESINDSFFVFNADHFYSPETYKKIFLTNESQNITVFCDQDRTLTHDDMKVCAKDGQFQKMDKQLTDYQWGYVGVSYVPLSLQQKYWEACLKVAQELGDKANVESVINQLAADGEPIAICDISGSWWTEIDTPEDLEKARAVLLPLLCKEGAGGGRSI